MDAQMDVDAVGWSDLPEALRVVLRGANLRKTIGIALFVGTVLFLINQLDVVVSGHATVLVWCKIGLTFVVPFCVSNYGILVATHRGRG